MLDRKSRNKWAARCNNSKYNTLYVYVSRPNRPTHPTLDELSTMVSRCLDHISKTVYAKLLHWLGHKEIVSLKQSIPVHVLENLHSTIIE